MAKENVEPPGAEKKSILFFIFFSFSIKSTVLQDPHFRTQNLVCSLQSSKFESFPRSNQTPLKFSPQKSKIFQNHRLGSKRSSKILNQFYFQKRYFYEQNKGVGWETQIWAEDLSGK